VGSSVRRASYHQICIIRDKKEILCESDNQLTTVVVLLSSFLLSTVTLVAQTASSDWSRLNSVASGSKLSVKLKNGTSVDGVLRGVSETALSLTVKNAAKEFRRDDVASVYEVSSKSATKATLIGLGVGAGAGAVVGAVSDSNNDSFETLDNAATAAATVVGAGVGALAGFFIGRSGRKRVLIYEAK
jgi:hypothetical protein